MFLLITKELAIFNIWYVVKKRSKGQVLFYVCVFDFYILSLEIIHIDFFCDRQRYHLAICHKYKLCSSFSFFVFCCVKVLLNMI